MRDQTNVNSGRRRTISFARTVVALAGLLAAVSSVHAETVLITGANRGLGLEFARQYAADGWDVIGTARRPDAATELNALDVRVMQLDVTDQASVDRLAADLGDEAIDLLINNAGILPRANTLADLDIDVFNRVLAVNTVGPIRVTQALLPHVKRGSGKTIAHITSRLGSIAGNTGGGYYGYRESKAALNMFNRSLASEMRSAGFTCVVLHPGWVQTDMGGKNATLTPQESVTGMRSVIAGLTQDDNSTFWNHAGEQLAW